MFAFQKCSEVHRRFYYIQVFCYASFYLVPFLRGKENDKGMFLAATNGLYMRVTAEYAGLDLVLFQKSV